jgi:hypothetical protein
MFSPFLPLTDQDLAVPEAAHQSVVHAAATAVTIDHAIAQILATGVKAETKFFELIFLFKIFFYSSYKVLFTLNDLHSRFKDG